MAGLPHFQGSPEPILPSAALAAVPVSKSCLVIGKVIILVERHVENGAGGKRDGMKSLAQPLGTQLLAARDDPLYQRTHFGMLRGGRQIPADECGPIVGRPCFDTQSYVDGLERN